MKYFGLSISNKFTKHEMEFESNAKTLYQKTKNRGFGKSFYNLF